jgi:hypothetical protein
MLKVRAIFSEAKGQKKLRRIHSEAFIIEVLTFAG